MNLTDWLGEHAWALWLGLAFLLAVAEIMSLDLVLIMLAAGALAGAATAALAPEAWWLQVGVAIVVSVGMLLVLRPDPDEAGARHAGLPVVHGQDGRQHGRGNRSDHQRRRRDQGGRSDLERPFLRPSTVIEKGTEIEVYEIDGAIAVVYPAHEPLP